jgi:hypothetical protein
MVGQDIFHWKRRTKLKRCLLARELATYKPYCTIALPALQEDEQDGKNIWKAYLGITEDPLDRPINKAEFANLKMRQLELSFEP